MAARADPNGRPRRQDEAHGSLRHVCRRDLPGRAAACAAGRPGPAGGGGAGRPAPGGVLVRGGRRGIGRDDAGQPRRVRPLGPGAAGAARPASCAGPASPGTRCSSSRSTRGSSAGAHTTWTPRTSRSSVASAPRCRSPTRCSGPRSPVRPRRIWPRRSRTGRRSSRAPPAAGRACRGCGSGGTARSCSRASSTPTTPAPRSTPGWTGCSCRTTAAGRPTARWARSARCRVCWRPSPAGCRCCSTPGSVPAPTPCSRWRSARTPCCSAVPTSTASRSTGRPGCVTCSAACWRSWTSPSP
jgi:hypothetical protein